MMLLAVDVLLEGADAGSIPDAIAWTSLQTPLLIAQGSFCALAALWAFRAHSRDAHRAAEEITAQAQLFAQRLSAGQDRVLSAMRVELERTRSAYDRAIEREWSTARAEVGKAYERIAKLADEAQDRFDEEHDRTIGRFNEALVILQQAGMASARIMAHKSDPKARRRL